MAKIGEVLVREGHLNQEGLEEALDWQVLYGGRLGTNLLELKLVEEEQLAQALGKQLGAEVAWGDIAIDPSVIGVIPKHIADQKEIVPWKLERRRLKMLCCQIDVAQFDQLASKVGRAGVPVVAPEYRIFQLLRAHYQATRQMRALDFGVVPEEGLEARRKKKEKEKGNVVEAAPELIDESAFNDIYAQVVAGRAPAAAAQPQQQWSPAPGTWPPGYRPPPPHPGYGPQAPRYPTPPQGVPTLPPSQHEALQPQYGQPPPGYPPPPPGYQYAPGYPPPPPGYQYAPIPQQPAPPQQPATTSQKEQAPPPGPPVMAPVQPPAQPPPAAPKPAPAQHLYSPTAARAP